MLTKPLQHHLKRLAAIACALILAFPASAVLKANTEYYIWLNIYEKLLGDNADATAPALSAYGTNASADSYVFIAEPSSVSGYVYLRQKSSGKYLAASSANGYSMVYETAKGTDSRFLWSIDEGTYVYLSSKKNGKCVGVDGAAKGNAYVSVYYDKPKGSHSQLTAIPATGGTWDASRWAYSSSEYTNAQGVREVDYCQLNGQDIDRADAIDIHITCNDNPVQGTAKVNLGSEDTWLIFDNIIPSKVASSYLKHVTIGGKTAVVNTNCRLAIYLNGTAVIPLPKTVMTCSGTDGDFTLSVGNRTNLGDKSNTMTSFTLKRGHMATLATGMGGKGYSRVYVADHADLNVTLPKALTKRVTSVNVKRWQYLSKKGWADTAGASRGTDLRASWFWSWSAGYSSSQNMEYVPCRQHRYWPSANDVNSKTASAAFSLNEPEHAEQHTKDKCSCGGTINEWTACTVTPDFLAGGGRIGSPQPTDFDYLTNYFKHVDDMAYRCDFSVTHAYWDVSGRNETDYANWFASQCKSIYSNTGRPLWITELEIGSSWGESWDKYSDKYGTYRKYLQVLLQKLEECDYVERYAIYSYDNYWAWMFYKDGGITPAGQVYRDHRSTFAYHASAAKEPVWWTPGVKEPTLSCEVDERQGSMVFTIGNTNGDTTDKLVLQRKDGDGWTDVCTVDDRPDMEKSSITVSVPLAEIDRENDMFRVVATTIYGAESVSRLLSVGYIANPGVYATSKNDIEGWTCKRNAANGFTKAESGDTYFEVWGPTASLMDFNYYQDVENLPDGIYRLSAVCFNSTNGVAEDAVNGNVGLYAESAGTLFYAPVTDDGEIDYARRTVVDSIVVSGGTMRIGLRNIGKMGARWAGADDFKLEYLCALDAVAASRRDSLLLIADSTLAARLPMADEADGTRDATGFIANAGCGRGTMDMWTAENVEVRSGEASDGDASNKYFDYWKQGSYTSSLYQPLGCLPEGEYVLSALVRATAGVKICLQAAVASASANEEYVAEAEGIGNVSPDGSVCQNGWLLLATAPFEVKHGERVDIKAFVSPSETAWWSADSFALTYKPVKKEPVTPDEPEQPDGISDVEDAAKPFVSYTLDGHPAEGRLDKGVRIIKQGDMAPRKVMSR